MQERCSGDFYVIAKRLVVAVAVALTAMLTCAPFMIGATKADSSLYDRLGGLRGITVVVDDFIDRLVANERRPCKAACLVGCL